MIQSPVLLALSGWFGGPLTSHESILSEPILRSFDLQFLVTVDSINKQRNGAGTTQGGRTMYVRVGSAMMCSWGPCRGCAGPW